MTTATEPQHLRELRHANEVRVAACALRREIAAGDVDLADALESDERGGSLPLHRLLSARRGWRDRQVEKFLARSAVPFGFRHRRCDELPPGVRATLVRELRRYEETR